jgi:hypothetical protein
LGIRYTLLSGRSIKIFLLPAFKINPLPDFPAEVAFLLKMLSKHLFDLVPKLRLWFYLRRLAFCHNFCLLRHLHQLKNVIGQHSILMHFHSVLPAFFMLIKHCPHFYLRLSKPNNPDPKRIIVVGSGTIFKETLSAKCPSNSG